MPAPLPPFVFISYAWESDAFRAQVKALCDYLRANGVAVVVDFDHAIKPPDVGWPVWMQQSIEDAAVVLVVCSASYRARFEKRAPTTSGKGVAWEGAVITQDLYNAALRNDKFYPIFPDPFKFDFCPTMLEPWSNGHAFPSKQADVLALVHACLGVPVAPVVDPRALAANPFNPWQAAVAPRFFGRDDLLHALHTALDEKRSVSIVGDRRIGKTSLLLAWKTQAEGLGRVVRWLSGEGAEAVSCTAFIQAITGETIAQDEAECAANALGRWADQFAVLPPLILLDEAEAVLKRLPHRFFERLRGLVGQQKLCLVLATARPVDQVYQDLGQTSPFMNLLELRRVGLLGQAAAEQMVALGNSVFDDAGREQMRRWAGRHPFFLALFGRRLWEACRDGVAMGEMLEMVNDDAGSILRQLWQTLGERERAALNRLVDGENVPTSGMRLRGLVVAGGHGDELFGEVLGLWLKRLR